MSRTRLLPFLFLLFVIGLAVGASSAVAADADTVLVAEVVPFSEDSNAGDKVKAECKLETKLTSFLKQYAKNPTVTLTSDPIVESEGKVLTLEIIHVLGPGGGAWSGTKSVTAKGELRQDGKVIGTFRSARLSGGGAFGGYKGTCSILGRCVKKMGSDIATWLANPTMDALLGDAQ